MNLKLGLAVIGMGPVGLIIAVSSICLTNSLINEFNISTQTQPKVKSSQPKSYLVWFSLVKLAI